MNWASKGKFSLVPTGLLVSEVIKVSGPIVLPPDSEDCN